MLTPTPATQAVIAGALGMAIGAADCFITRQLVKNRCKESYTAWYINKTYSPLLWAIAFSAIYVTGTLLECFTEAIPLMAMMIPFAAIAATDAKIRKIPNSMLLGLIAEIIVFIVLGAVFANKEPLIGKRIFSTFIGLVVFTIPSVIKMPVGMGDIKLACILAFRFMIFGFIQITAIMGIGFAIAAIILYATKKGDIKTAIPMGPFLVLGAVITLIFPLF